MCDDLQGKVAIVTGGSRDIGAAISKHLASLGMNVVIDYPTDKEEKNAQDIQSAIMSDGGKAITFRADVTKEDEVQLLAESAINQFGRLDCLVNNAGGFVVTTPLLKIKRSEWERVIELNAFSTILMAQSAVPLMKNGGTIVNIASLAASNGGGPGRVAYAASKATVLTLTKGMAKEFAPLNVRVNAISPGVVNTSFQDDTPNEVRQSWLKVIPLGREGEAVDVANTVAFLASENSSYITGQEIHLNGGMYFG